MLRECEFDGIRPGGHTNAMRGGSAICRAPEGSGRDIVAGKDSPRTTLTLGLQSVFRTIHAIPEELRAASPAMANRRDTAGLLGSTGRLAQAISLRETVVADLRNR
jgi:hypothetical protein